MGASEWATLSTFDTYGSHVERRFRGGSDGVSLLHLLHGVGEKDKWTHTRTCGRGRFAGRLGGQLLSRSLSTSWLSCCLFSSGHGTLFGEMAVYFQNGRIVLFTLPTDSSKGYLEQTNTEKVKAIGSCSYQRIKGNRGVWLSMWLTKAELLVQHILDRELYIWSCNIK